MIKIISLTWRKTKMFLIFKFLHMVIYLSIKFVCNYLKLRLVCNKMQQRSWRNPWRDYDEHIEVSLYILRKLIFEQVLNREDISRHHGAKVNVPFKINLDKQGVCMKKMKPQSVKKALHIIERLYSLNLFITLI
jgi:hypothetical protein